ncbi:MULTISPECIES: hypothetical protein [Archaeoglobus]|jgi:hypothetical protein|uniref:Uncharacterized protein AF_0712 n=2 Tax=Archaeoglobus fulgidus TaxID=2234 RepID=Y712_ARCFU|nr:MULTISPECIES: hypothetical protein [Archaeoglobus]O29546.1 RecName: Full=Uncharacterized protein AF_0712 [Archaeoglobus fulgidus DSM 4304]AAB90528.1 conserved hypothetical protein [Archaeoglobus fulgidus DSM 4304]AIG97591.1 hypothetical protein AFULGI_00007940 [Archaeoglobus fulgidus DSM 8774]MDI3498836.1 hypothetical protein [Archaeoglobus sp.]
MRRLAILLSLAGIADSSYLLLSEAVPCPTGVCASISVFSLPPFVPALLGLCWFVLSIVVFTAGVNRALLTFWRFSGVFGESFLGTYAVLHGYFCPYCFTAYGIGIVVVAISEKLYG